MNLPRYFAIFALYAAAWGSIFLDPTALYWDDWVWYDSAWDLPSLIAASKELGAPLYGFVNWIELQLGAAIVRLLIFVLMFLIVLCFTYVLRYLPSPFEVSPNLIFIAGCLFAIVPMYHARYSLTLFKYTLSLSAFMLAWVILLISTSKNSKTLYLFIGSTLFWLSFTLNSLLVFFVVPVMQFGLYQRKLGVSWNRIAANFVWLFLLPLSYFSFSRGLFPAYGSYEGYNRILLPRTFFGLLILFFMCLIFVFGYLIIKNQKEILRQAWLFTNMGIVLGWLGFLPYYAVGRPLLPVFREWASRDEILLPFGVVFILLGLRFFLKNLAGMLPTHVLDCVLILAFSLVSASFTLGYVFDSRWQNGVIDQVSLLTTRIEDRLVLIQDGTDLSRLYQRGLRQYEWNGILQVATGSKSHFAIEIDSALESEEIFLAPEVQDYLQIDDESALSVFGQSNYIRSSAHLPTTSAVILNIDYAWRPLTKNFFCDYARAKRLTSPFCVADIEVLVTAQTLYLTDREVPTLSNQQTD